MRIIFFSFFCLCSSFTRASNFYVNPSSEAAKESGSFSTPWKSIASVNAVMKKFRAGDSIFLKRGELYFDKLIINCTGKENAPIVFTSYGTAAAKPVFLFKAANNSAPYETIRLTESLYVVVDGFDITDDSLDPEDHAHLTNIITAVSIEASNFISIKNIHISLAGTGISISGNSNTVDKCMIRNLRMIRNTVGGSDDYGANAVIINGSNNIISNCFFKDCWANSYDYTFYGGVVKMQGAANNNNTIMNNTAVSCVTFLEILSSANTSMINNLTLNNNIINCDELVYLNANEKYKMNAGNLRFQHNNIINTLSRLPDEPGMINIEGSQPGKAMLNLQDNIFWITSDKNIANESQVSEGRLIHQNNIYYLASGKLNFREDKSELLLNSQSEFLKKIALKHPDLLNPDEFPFFYLLKNIDDFIY